MKASINYFDQQVNKCCVSVKLKDGDMLLEIKKSEEVIPLKSLMACICKKCDVVQFLRMLSTQCLAHTRHNVQVLVDTLYSARYESVPHHARHF